MGKKKAPEDSGKTGERLASVSTPVEDVGPEVFLRMEVPGPRGFWAREGRWFAHLGAASVLQVTDPGEGGGRFRDIWTRGRDLLDGSAPVPGSQVPPPPARFFGGFAFREGHLPREAWQGFPSAHFVLPEVELMGQEGGAVLTCRGFLSPDEDDDRCRDRLRDRLAQLREALISPPAQVPPGEPWIPATRVETDLESWQATVDRALEEMKGGKVSKVVLARVQSVVAEGGLDPVEVVMNLWRENLTSHVFFFEPSPEHVLLGAAPETVATLENGRFRATAVAGSAPSSEREADRKRLAQRLLKSEKDRLEHRVCVEDMISRIEPLAKKVQADEEPHILTLSTIQHLESVIEAELKKGQTVLSVLEALHPTPAICGLPRDLALEFLNREEPFHRGWYSGPVGWFDGAGNGVFVPALRSAVGHGEEWRLFAGAGIVAGSEPRQEWDETRIKFQPVLRALSRAGAGRTSALSSAEES